MGTHSWLARVVSILVVSILLPGVVGAKGPPARRWASYPPPSITVAADGTGDFRSVQKAVDAALKLGKNQVVILVLPGLYK